MVLCFAGDEPLFRFTLYNHQVSSPFNAVTATVRPVLSQIREVVTLGRELLPALWTGFTHSAL
uniref:Uncharacterized protein n=1 Tax=Anguilla anguilla TaxID=7936 RepID=A0A0E9UFJ9_ANGAN